MGAGRGSWEKVTPRERHAVRGEREILMRKLMRKLQSGKLPAKWRPEPPTPLTVTMHWGRATFHGGELSHCFFIITPLEHNSKLVSVRVKVVISVPCISRALRVNMENQVKPGLS